MHYLALTIGPIVKTLQQARKTRELWAASYLLSTLMKHLMHNLDETGKHILIPQIPASVTNKVLYGAGIYPDRLFMEADHLIQGDDKATRKVIDELIDKSLVSLAKDCLKLGELTEADVKNKAVPFWKEFFRIRYHWKPLSDINNGKLSSELTPYLEIQELEDTSFYEEPAEDYLQQLFEIDRLYNCPLIDHLKGDNRGTYDSVLKKSSLIPSTSEIAALELYDHPKVHKIAEELDQDKEEHEAFYLNIEADKSLSKFLKPRHKYFCIVQADGDNIGKAIQTLNKPQDYKGFSTTLAEYGAEAAGIINTYGGKPIYIGGDDLLFLASVHTSEGSVLDLIEKLDKSFPMAKLHPNASLSFGLNIVYYKFPLFEAIGDAYGILKRAKDFKNKNGEEKNSISFQFTKHSGSAFQGVFSKEMLNGIIKAIKTFEGNAPEGKSGIVSALIFKLYTLDKLFRGIAGQLEKKDSNFEINQLKARLTKTLDHFFNEWDKEPGFEAQKNAIIELLILAYNEAPDSSSWIDSFYAIMRLIHFSLSPSEALIYDTEDQPATA